MLKKSLSTLAIAALGGIIALGMHQVFVDKQSSSATTNTLATPVTYASLKEGGNVGFDFVKVSEVSTPTVVHIKTTYPQKPVQQMPFDPFGFFGDGFNIPRGPQMATGSGVIMSVDGLIVTNNHVIADAEKIEVILNDKRTYIAEVVGTDPSTDLAVIRIDEKDLPFLSFGNSEELHVGEWVVAVGNPMNLTSTVTAGIVSAKGRSIDLLRSEDNKYAIENFIQTDAAVNPGNSGGALVNTRGQLIGINTAIASQTGSYMGYSFAVPSNLVKKVFDDIVKFGTVQRGVLGVSIQDVTAKLAEEKELKSLKGVYVADVIGGSAAEKAGVKAGDVILKINNKEINSSSGLQEEVGQYRPGDKIKVLVNRKGTEKELTVTLLNRDGKSDIVKAENAESTKAFGATFKTLTAEEKLSIKVRSGVKIAEVEKGPFKDAGIKPGFIITHIDKQPVATPQAAFNLLKDKKGGVLIEGKEADGTDAVVGVKVN